MKLSGQLTRKEIDDYVDEHPEISFIVMCAIAEALCLPKGIVYNNNQPNSYHVISFEGNTTVDIGTEVIAITPSILNNK